MRGISIEIPRRDKLIKMQEAYERWQKGFESKYGGVLERDINETFRERKLLWRGMSGRRIFNLLDGNEIELASHWPNATIDPDKAISYYHEDPEFPCNMAIGFLPSKDVKVEKALSRMSIAKDLPKGAYEYQDGNYIVNGKLQDAKYVLVRAHTGVPGEVGEVLAYKIKQDGQSKPARSAT